MLTAVFDKGDLALVSWLATLELGLRAYGTIFVSMMVVALVMPEEPALLACGLAVGAWQAHPGLALLAAIAGVLTTDVALYALGRFGGRRLLLGLRLHAWLSEKRRLAIARGFCQAGAAWLIAARLFPIPGLRTSVFVSAGMVRYPWWRFLLYDAVFLGPVGAILVLGGYNYAEAMGRWLQGFDTLRYWLALLVALVIGGAGLWYLSEWLGRKLSQAVDSEPVQRLPDSQMQPSCLAAQLVSEPSNSQTGRNGQYFSGKSETVQQQSHSSTPASEKS